MKLALQEGGGVTRVVAGDPVSLPFAAAWSAVRADPSEKVAADKSPIGPRWGPR